MIGKSGRIVIEIEPEMKQQLYSALASKGLNLKEWFVGNVDDYLENYGQISLPMMASRELQTSKAKK